METRQAAGSAGALLGVQKGNHMAEKMAAQGRFAAGMARSVQMSAVHRRSLKPLDPEGLMKLAR